MSNRRQWLSPRNVPAPSNVPARDPLSQESPVKPSPEPKKVVPEAPKVGPATAALEPLPPLPEDDPDIIGEALCIVRKGRSFQIIGVKITPETPHRVIREIKSDSGLVASGALVKEIMGRVNRLGLVRASSIKEMTNIVDMTPKAV